jgi:hypothetical protein
MPDSMSKEELGQMYVEYLRQEGYRPELKEDTVVFQFQGESFHIGLVDDPEVFLLFGHITQVGTGDAERAAVKAALAANTKTKVAKVALVDGQAMKALSIFCNPPDRFHRVFARCLSALQHVEKVFLEELNAGTS